MRKADLYNQLRDGVAPSRVWLPPDTLNMAVHEFLCTRFPQIPATYWAERIAAHQVLWGDGSPVSGSPACRPGQWLLYYREVPDEPVIPFQYDILYEDEELIVVDKPHFLPTNPAGRYLRETALSRLKQQYDSPVISPLHRLDRETAGVLMFSRSPKNRAAYHHLFASHQIQKVYQAVLAHGQLLPKQFTYASRLQKGHPFCLMQEVAGPANSETAFLCLRELSAQQALYQLRPKTGQQHQLRVHCASLRAGILHDRFYPGLLPDGPDNYERPLQLLAQSVAFTDPLTGQPRYFASKRQLVFAR